MRAIVWALLLLCSAARAEPSLRGKAMSEWIALLDASSPTTRADAAELIGCFGSEAASAAPLLARFAVRDPHPSVRHEAMLALTRVDRSGERWSRILLADLRSDYVAIRRTAAIAWTLAGPAAGKAVEPLIAALRDDDAIVRATVADALGRIDPPDRSAAVALASTLRDPDATVRRMAAAALADMGPAAAPALAALAAALQDSDSAVRFAVVDALPRLGTSDAASRAALIAVLHSDPDAEVRERATWAMFSPDARVETVEALARAAMGDRSNAVRAGSRNALVRCGAAAKPAVAVLRTGLGDADAERRDSAAWALGLLGPLAADAVDDLVVAAVADSRRAARPAAGSPPLWALGKLGRSAASATSQVIGILQSGNDVSRAEGAAALGEFGPSQPATDALADALTDSDPWVRRQAAVALGKYAADAAPAVADLVAVFRRPDVTFPFQRLSGTLHAIVAESLTAIGLTPQTVMRHRLASPDPDSRTAAVRARLANPWNAETAFEIAALLRQRDPAVRAAAAEVLGSAGEKALPAVPEILLALLDADAEVRAAAAQALAANSVLAAATVNTLMARLERRSAGVRREAAQALGAIGSTARPSVTALEKLASDDADESVRAAAAQAYSRILTNR